ncbi:TPA: hypothetical protein ACGBG5_002937 [Enterococcus faecalis]
MTIFNMEIATFQLLSDIKELEKVVKEYPESWEIFPMAVFKTKRTPHVVDINKEEVQSYWTVTIEIYEDSYTDLIGTIINQVDQAFKNIGFVGTVTDANTAGLTRKICEYSAVIDNGTHFVYQK